MTLRRLGFTLVELMIVIAIIWLLTGALYPQMTGYLARGRDTARISDIKELSSKFQNYTITNGTYPSNTNAAWTLTRYCVNDVFIWPDAVGSTPLAKSKKFTQLWGTGAVKRDPQKTNTNIGLCTATGSYFYSQLPLWGITYGVVAARMERQTTGANYTFPLRLNMPVYINAMKQAQPLSKSGSDIDKIFLLITN